MHYIGCFRPRQGSFRQKREQDGGNSILFCQYRYDAAAILTQRRMLPEVASVRWPLLPEEPDVELELVRAGSLSER